MTSSVKAKRSMPPAARTAVSNDGYSFDIESSRWKLNKDTTVVLGNAASLEEPVQGGFRATLQRYAEEMSARHTALMAEKFNRFLRDSDASSVDVASLLNWRASLTEAEQHNLGGLKGFLLAWHGYGFEGVTDDAVDLLNGWRIKGNHKGVAVRSGSPTEGPYTDLEVAAILDWSTNAVARKTISFEDFAYLMTLVMTARRPVQIAALRGGDLVEEKTNGVSFFRIKFPRAKQRGGGFRKDFRSLAVIEDLYVVLQHQHSQSVEEVQSRQSERLSDEAKAVMPIFLNKNSLSGSTSFEATLQNQEPDFYHMPVKALGNKLRRLGRVCKAHSERTGAVITLSSTRFRYTRGTKLRREGFGAFVIAELLDHGDVQNVGIYTENTAQDAVVINKLVGSKLAPFAQACMGTLVRSERDAIRGDDPNSRVANNKQNAAGTCGNYGFCASGYRACYTCHHFQPWVDGPHDEVLVELYTEKERVREAGCDDLVVNANDQLILAVEHCIAMCTDAKAEAAAEANGRQIDG